MTPTQEALCEGDSSSLTLSSSPVESCASSCTPLSYNCSEDALTITYADQVLCNEELDTAKYDTCQCQVFWYGNDCTTHFIDVYPSTSRGYSIFFCVVFLGLSIFSGREIYKHVTELEESAKKLNKQISNRNGGKTNEMGRRRSSTLQFNRPKSMGRTTMVSGFFQPTRVRILVQSCCFLASFLRFIYLFNMTLRVCYEGQVCSSVVFEPANIAIISAGLLTVMFWKKMGMMFRKGVNQATQNDEDIRFFQIFGFYTIFQFTMIVVTATAESMNIEMHALYNISLLVSGIYMIGLLYGSIKFGMTLIRLLHGTRKGGDGDAKAKTWKKVRKVVYMLSIVVPAGVGYLISLGVYMMMGMRGIPKMWMPMQFVFRFLEVAVIWGLTSCLRGKPPPKEGERGGMISTTGGIEIAAQSINSKVRLMSKESSPASSKNFFSKQLSIGQDSKHINVIKEADEDFVIDESKRESNFV